MFAGAVRANIFGRVRKLAIDTIHKHLKDKDITENKVTDCRKEPLAVLETLSVPEVPNRTIALNWLGEEVKIQVESPAEECRIRLHGYIKERALFATPPAGSAYVLSPLFVEKQLLGMREAGRHTIAPGVIKQYETARKTATDMLSADQHSQGSAILDCLVNNEDVLALIDESICIEVAWYRHMLNEGGVKMLQESVAKVMPAGPGVHEARDVAAMLDQLKLGALYRFLPAEARSSMNIVAEWVVAIAQNRSPSLSAAADSPFLTSMKESLSHLCYHQVLDPTKEVPEYLSGASALTAKFDEIANRIDAQESLNMEQLRVFHVFAWLLSPAQKAKHSKWCNDIYRKAGATSNVSVATASPAAAKKGGGPSGAAAKQNAASVEESTMSLFKRRRTT